MNSTRSAVLAICNLSVLSVYGARAADAASPASPCALLTTAQDSAVLGVQVAEGVLVVPKLCDWSAASKLVPSP